MEYIVRPKVAGQTYYLGDKGIGVVDPVIVTEDQKDYLESLQFMKFVFTPKDQPETKEDPKEAAEEHAEVEETPEEAKEEPAEAEETPEAPAENKKALSKWTVEELVKYMNENELTIADPNASRKDLLAVVKEHKEAQKGE